MTVLSQPLTIIKGVGPKTSELFARKGIRTIEDALYFVPADYEDRRKITRVADLEMGKARTVLVRIESAKEAGRPRQRRLNIVASDGTGNVELVWFNVPMGFSANFPVGDWFLFCGDVRNYAGRFSITHPDSERVVEKDFSQIRPSVNFGRVIPIYSQTEGLTTKAIRRVMNQVLDRALPALEDGLPWSLREELGLPTLRESFTKVHFPEEVPSDEIRSPAIQRIIFEEFFVLQLGLGLKQLRQKRERAEPFTDPARLKDAFVQRLPFAPTGDQTKAVAAIAKDLGRDYPMARLLQGDVGAGKTVVAMAAAAMAAGSGFQSVLMVPTEILAQQHYATAMKLLAPLGVSVECLTGGKGSRECTAQFTVGTHALFQKGVSFDRLGLVVVDEQHRFGVDQRNSLLKKNFSVVPHLLMMTATPIPRTLALTCYGDLDLTILREKPASRKPILTRVMREGDRPRIYNKIRETTKSGGQVYVIYPLVEDSDKLELKSATEMHRALSKEIFPDLKVGLLHGRLAPEEKDHILNQFKAGKIQVLISTTVIEVGIDVPNATLMVIEHPERLGLSQLHQLRGRVGRGTRESECYLLAGKGVGVRLRVMEATEDGFEIAEEDLKIRGPGEFLGTRQSGLPGFRVGHLLKDADLLSLAREKAQHILERDPELVEIDHQGIRAMVESRWREKIERLRGG